MTADPRTTALIVVALMVALAACFAASEGALLALSDRVRSKFEDPARCDLLQLTRGPRLVER